MKSDGSYTYFAADMAYHHNKLARGFRHLINVFGADHVGYIKRMKAAVAALSGGKADLDIKVCQLVRLFRAGEPVRMSKRAGTFVTLREVVDEVGRDPVRFMMLYRKNDAPLDFDLAKVVEQSKDNPGLLRAVRARAGLVGVSQRARGFSRSRRRSRRRSPSADLSRLDRRRRARSDQEARRFPASVAAAPRGPTSRTGSPSISMIWLPLFTRNGRKAMNSPHLRFIQASDGTLTAARLALVRANAQVLASGLAILGVHAPVEMR